MRILHMIMNIFFLNELLLFVLSWTIHAIPYMGGLD
jgi:hypothetical protein